MKWTVLNLVLLLPLVGTLTAGDLYAKDGTYDFFGLARYPEGGKLVDGVELYKVKEPGGGAREYKRRVVQWWPRKGVDIIEVTDDVPLREWTLNPDMLDETASDPKFEWETYEHEALDMPVNVAERYVRHIEGYLHPPKDDDYTFKIAADDMGVLFISTDDSRENKRLACHSWTYSHRNEFTRRDGQISKPIPLKKGRKYYFEILHYEGHANDCAMVVWETPTLEQEVIGGAAVSTLDGRAGKVIEKRAPEPAGWREVETKIRPPDQPRVFKAYLVGFDGVGNELGNPLGGEDCFEPSVLLRMADGRKRNFPRGSFCQKDREFIMEVYLKEMKRVRAASDKTVYEVSPRLRKEFPGGTPLGEPGTWLKQSEHLVIPSGSQGESDWLSIDNPELGERYRASVFRSFENMHAYIEYGGHLMPYWDRSEKYKYEGRGGNTIKDGTETIKSGAGGGYGGQGLMPEPKPGGGFSHEYGHGFVMFNTEITAQHMMDLIGGDRPNTYLNSVTRPWRHCLFGSYDTTLFFRTIGYDPNWGHTVVLALPEGVGERGNFLATLARVGQQRGIFKDGIRGVGDTVGDYGARMAEFDLPNQQLARGWWFSVKRNYLEPLDKEKGLYRIPWDEAPEPFGVNIVRLLPEAGGDAIVVDFRGYHDPAVYSDWRACIVAVDRQGQARYSDLWSKGVMRMERREGDLRYWLTVAATPTALPDAGMKNAGYSGHFAPRYPWQAAIEGAVPGAPQQSRSDLNDVYGSYGHLWIHGFIPVVPRTDAERAFLTEAGAFVERMEQSLPKQNLCQRMHFGRNIRHARKAISNPKGAPHPNGGGWVSSTAEAAPAAYIGPHVRVLDHAKVLDHAIVEDYAVIKDRAVISGRARVGGQAVISGDTKLAGYQRAWMPLELKAEEDAPDVTARFKEAPDENGLWANYAMDQAEAAMLEDYYRSRNSNEFFVPVYNGYLYGNPEFVVDGPRRGLSFDGKTQYAELNRRIADLGEITVDMTVKWQPSTSSRPGVKECQVLLDCGSGPDNRFTLTTGGKSGGVVLEAVVDGKSVVSLTSSEALEQGAWTRVRLEIDGKKVALWIDDKPAGEQASEFRPADVFKPGVAQRNFIAAGRDGKDKFKGVYDHVLVYHKVHGKAFAKLPQPFLDAPRRPRKGFALSVLRSMGASPFEQADRKGRMSDRLMNHWRARGGRALTRVLELHWSVPEYRAAAEKAKAFEQWKKDADATARKAFEESGEAAALKARMTEITEQLAALNEKINALPKPETAEDQAAVRPEPTEEMVERRKEIEALEAEIAALEKVEEGARAAVEAMPETTAARDEIARLEKEVQPLTEACRKKLAEAVANDPSIKALKSRPPNYIRADVRVMRAMADGAVREAAGGLAFMVQERLKKEDAAFRQWAEASERLEEIKREELYRVHDYLLHHTDHPKLLHQNRWDRGELAEARGKLSGLQRQLQDAEQTAHNEPPGEAVLALRVEKEVLESRLREIRDGLNQARAVYVEEKLKQAGLQEKNIANEDRLKEVGEIVGKKYHAELHTLYSFLRQNFHGYYNLPIAGYVASYADSVVGGVTLRDRLAEVEGIEDLYAPENWKISVDQWDWRTHWEKDGSIEELPLVRKWLKRVRGE